MMITYLPDMNHLAHLLIAGDDPALQLGAMLGDHVRGNVHDSGFAADICRGIMLHRKVDGWTDQHALLAGARCLFNPPYRRYAGILLDVYFDHLLSRQWPLYSTQSLTEFNQQVLALLARHRRLLPPGLVRFYHYAKATGVLARYAETQMLEQVFHGISQRLRHANPVATALPVLQQHAAELHHIFAEFWPQLQQTSKLWLADQQADQPFSVADRHPAPRPHWLKKPDSDR